MDNIDACAQTDASLIDLKLLRLLDLLYTTHSVTRAAEQLGQSQPTVSIWLSKLRHQLRDPLFVRTLGGMQPTPRAEEFVVTVREVLTSLRQLSAGPASFDPASASRRFRICMTDASHITLLPPLLAHVHALAPQVRLVAAGIGEDTAHALQSGDADLAIGLVPWLEAGFYQQALFPQDWVCLVNQSHARVGTILSRQIYQREGHVGIQSGTGAQLLEASLSRHRIKRRVMLELPGFLGLGAIISTTDLIATLPRHIGGTLARVSGLRLCECPFPVPPFTVKQHWHARFHNDPANRWMRGVCAALFMKSSSKGKAQSAEQMPQAASIRSHKTVKTTR